MHLVWLKLVGPNILSAPGRVCIIQIWLKFMSTVVFFVVFSLNTSGNWGVLS